MDPYALVVMLRSSLLKYVIVCLKCGAAADANPVIWLRPGATFF